MFTHKSITFIIIYMIFVLSVNINFVMEHYTLAGLKTGKFKMPKMKGVPCMKNCATHLDKILWTQRTHSMCI